MRYSFLLVAALSMTACKAMEHLPAPVSQPVVVAGDTVTTVTTISVGKKSTVTLQMGTANTAATVGTDNTGRDASSGANGGKSEATDKVPLWALALLALVAAGLGAWGWEKLRPRPG